jgi:hypothetical protein
MNTASTSGRLTAAQIESALQTPASVFSTPEEVIEHDDLTREQKIEILWRWQYDAAELGVAVEEGMPGEDNGLLRRIMLALGTLTGPIDLEHTGPTKQHGLPRSVLARPPRHR